MKRSGWSKALLLLLAWALAMAGCGHTAVYKEPEDKEAEPTVIRIAWWGGDERHAATKEILELYTREHPDVVFETLPSSWDSYYDNLLQETVQGEMPDLIQMDYQYITTYSENGSLTDLTPFVEDGTIEVDDIEKNILNSGLVNGELSGIVLATSLISMIYNSEVFDEAGLSYPESDWTWDDFVDICMKIQEQTGKYGAAMTPVLDINLYHYWVRQHGEELFSEDCRSLGYADDVVYVDYVTMFRTLMDADAVPDSDHWAEIAVREQEKLPVVTGEGGMMQEWNNFLSRMSYVNDKLKLVTPPLADGEESFGLWMKPSMFFSVAETSKAKRECAEFINWFLHSEEANEILRGERGIPVSERIRSYLTDDTELTGVQREMFAFADEAEAFCGETPPPEPSGIDGINEAFARTANAYFYDMVTAEEAAADFRKEVEEILSAYEP